MPITWIQVSHWKSSITIFKHAIRVTDKKYPDFSVAHNNLGNTLRREGKNSEAISHYKMAIKVKPDYADAYNNLGAVLFADQKTEEAISHFKKAIELNPGFTAAQKNLEKVLLRSEELE